MRSRSPSPQGPVRVLDCGMTYSYPGAEVSISMTAKPTVSLTDQAFEFAKSLVARGQFASLSAVVQYGLRLVEREDEEHRARLDAIRADLDRRAGQPSIPSEDMDARLAAWRAARDRESPADLA